MSLITDTTNAIQTMRSLDAFGIAAILCDKSGMVQLVNTAGGALLGREPAQLAGSVLNEMDGFEPLAEMLAAGQPQVTPKICSLLHQLHCYVRMQKIGNYGFLFTLEDVTQFVDMQDQQSTILQMVAHDLKTPLSAIKSFSDLVIGAGGLSNKQNSFMRRILLAVRNMDGLVRDLVDMAWLNDESPLEMMPVNLGEIIRSSLELLEYHSAKRNITIETTIPDDLPEMQGDAQRLERVFVNLIGNAIKYTAIGGKVTVKVEKDETNLLIVAVTDTGIGIPPDQIPHIFKRFYRVDNRSNKSEGTGLGLSIVDAIVRRHGGRIEVESELEKGSTFKVKLPQSSS